MTFTSSPDCPAAVASAWVQNVLVTMDTQGRVRACKGQRRLILAEFERSWFKAPRSLPSWLVQVSDLGQRVAEAPVAGNIAHQTDQLDTVIGSGGGDYACGRL
jgi:hypothetical protein